MKSHRHWCVLPFWCQQECHVPISECALPGMEGPDELMSSRQSRNRIRCACCWDPSLLAVCLLLSPLWSCLELLMACPCPCLLMKGRSIFVGHIDDHLWWQIPYVQQRHNHFSAAALLELDCKICLCKWLMGLLHWLIDWSIKEIVNLHSNSVGPFLCPYWAILTR